MTPATPIDDLAGRSVLVLNWRDLHHPEAGGAERYAHEIARRWADRGVSVTWLSASWPGAPRREVIDGIRVLRRGGTFSVYGQAAGLLLRTRSLFDAVVDCQNGIPFFAPLFAGGTTAVVEVVHHVHQEQFATRFGWPMREVGRYLEGPVSRWVYGERPVVAVSPSTRQAVRQRLRMAGPIFVVPNGAEPPVTPPRAPSRTEHPSVTIVSRLVPHKRLDLVLAALPAVRAAMPTVRVDVVGDGPDRERLEGLARDLGVDGVRFRGYVDAAERDRLLARAWITVTASQGEGWGISVIEANRFGVPCLAYDVAGLRDSILPGVTGWLIDHDEDLGVAMVDALQSQAGSRPAERRARACRQWAQRFSWDRSAERLAAVVGWAIAEREGRAGAASGPDRHPFRARSARSDLSVVATLDGAGPAGLRPDRLRLTDQVVAGPDGITVLLHGCDEVGAGAVLHRIGVRGSADLRVASASELLLAFEPAPDLDPVSDLDPGPGCERAGGGDLDWAI